MSHVEKRGAARYMAVYADPETGKSRSRSFKLKRDADDFLKEVDADQLRGTWIDPARGRVTVAQYGAQWLAQAPMRESTRVTYGSYLKYIDQTLGPLQLGALRPSHARAWQAKVSERYAPSTASTIRAVLCSILRAAVVDRLILTHPFDGLRMPAPGVHELVTPLPVETVESIAGSIFERYRAAVWIGAGCGLRPGETFALQASALNMLRRELSVERTLYRGAGSRPGVGPPKTRASLRKVPMPKFVVAELAAHMAAFPPVDGYMFTTSRGQLVNSDVRGSAWQHSGAPAGTGFHDLRHFYASALIHAGEDLITVSARLGHASTAETSRTYAHLWPNHEDRTRAAIEGIFGSRENETSFG